MDNLTVPAPANRTELMAQRRILKHVKTLNDAVDDAYYVLYDDQTHPLFYKLVQSVWNSEAIEGHIVADDYEAARYMRVWAKEHDQPHIEHAKLHTIVRSLRIVMRRYSMSRKERRITVHGETVPGAQDELNLNGNDEA